MSRIALTEHDMRMKQVRRSYVPVGSILFAILLSLLPIVAETPLLPDFAFLTALAWRLLRPEMWTAKAALALGFVDDIFAGHPIGQAMALWTLAFLIVDLVDSRAIYRDYWMDWLLASALVVLHTLGGWYIARIVGSRVDFSIMLPQIGMAVLAYPIVARAVVALDRWRLTR